MHSTYMQAGKGATTQTASTDGCIIICTYASYQDLQFEISTSIIMKHRSVGGATKLTVAVENGSGSTDSDLTLVAISSVIFLAHLHAERPKQSL